MSRSEALPATIPGLAEVADSSEPRVIRWSDGAEASISPYIAGGILALYRTGTQRERSAIRRAVEDGVMELSAVATLALARSLQQENEHA